MDTKRKILSLEKAAALRRQAGRTGKKTVFTNGCFDILHSGHVFLLEKARSLGDVLIVGINSDASVRRLKGAQRPFNKLSDRARLLAALESVDMVVAFTRDTPYELIKALKPDVLVKGADYDRRNIVGKKFAGRTIRVPLVKGLSTTGLVEKIKNQICQQGGKI